MKRRGIFSDDRGAAMIEMAFALPIFIMMVWMLVQLGFVFRATSGMQHALGEGARFATIWPTPTPGQIQQRVLDEVYGTRPGTFNVPMPVVGDDCDNRCVDLVVEYEQSTNLLLVPGPTIEVSRTKRVWVAEAAAAVAEEE